MNKQTIIKNIIAFGIGIAVLTYLISVIGFEKIFLLLTRIRIEFFIIAAFFYLLVEIASAYILKIAIEKTATDGRIVSRIGLMSITLAHMCGMLYSAVTPGRVGYYYTAFSLSKKTKNTRSANIGIITIIHGVYFLTKAFLCIVAAIYFSTVIISIESLNYLLILSIVPILFVILIMLVIYTKIPNRIIARIPVLCSTLGYITMMQDSCKRIKKDVLMKIALGGFGVWVLMGLQWFFIAKSLNLDISVLMALFFQPVLATAMFIPISPGGLGFAEGGGALLFKILGYTPEAGAAFILLIRLNSILVDSIGLIDMRAKDKAK